MHPLRWAAALCALAASTSAHARPFGVEDFLRLESPGYAWIDPTAHWLIHDSQGAYLTAPRFDLDTNTRPLHSHLLRVDLHHPAHGVPAFEQDRRGSYLPGPFSPDGRFVTIYRDLDRHWDLGVLDIAARRVRWLGFGADFTDKGDTVVWRSPTHLVALKMPPGDRYWKERFQQGAMEKLPALWAQQRTGKAASVVTIGSGRYIDTHVADPMRQVVDVDAETGHQRGYASGVFDSLALSAGGRRLALIEASGRNHLPEDHLLGPATQFRRASLRLLDLQTGVLVAPCPSLEPLFSSLRWSPTSEDLLIFSRPVDAPDWTGGAYQRVGADGACEALPLGPLKAKTTAGKDGDYTRSHGEWLSGAPLILATTAGQSRADWFRLAGAATTNVTAALKTEPADPVLIDQDHAVFLEDGVALSVDAQGAARREAAEAITRIHIPLRSNNSALAPEDGAPRGGEIFATSDTDTSTTLWRLTPTSASKVLVLANHDQRYRAATASGLVTLRTDVHGTSALELHTADAKAVVLATANPQLAKVEIAIPIPIAHLGPNGEPVKSWLYMPTAPRARKPPVVVMAYPGAVYASPPPCGTPGACMYVTDNPLFLVGHGYAVLFPSLPTPEGTSSPSLTWGKQMDAVLDAVAKTNLVDTERAGYWGHSYGGYAGLALAEQSGRFKAIIAAAAATDMTSIRAPSSAAWLTPHEAEAIGFAAGWTEMGQGGLLGTPWTARERIIEASPIFGANRIKTPLLLVQGDQDFLTINQSREMFSALYRLDKDALFMTFYGEGHSIVSPANIRAYVHGAFDFLDRYLAPQSSTPAEIADRPPSVSQSRSGAPNAAPTPLSQQRRADPKIRRAEQDAPHPERPLAPGVQARRAAEGSPPKGSL